MKGDERRWKEMKGDEMEGDGRGRKGTEGHRSFSHLVPTIARLPLRTARCSEATLIS